MKKIFLLTLLVFFFAFGLYAQTITMESLLDEMVNPTALTEASSGNYTTFLASSWDQRSLRTGLMNANWDRSYFLGEEINEGRKEYILLKSDKPGAATRFWITFHGKEWGREPFYNGTLRVYLDGSTEPALEGPIWDLLSKQVLAPEALSFSVAKETPEINRGHNLYLPITWAKSCKMTYESPDIADEGAVNNSEALYYQINYREYDTNTKVESYSSQVLAKNKAKIEEVSKILTAKLTANKDSSMVINKSNIIVPKGESVVFNLEGEQAIDFLQIKIDGSKYKGLGGKKLQQLLRSVALRITFDNEQSSYVPVGAFFGIGYRLDPLDTFLNSATESGCLTSKFVMPFKNSAKIELINYGKSDFALNSIQISTKPYNFTNDSYYFHADWNYQGVLDANPKNRPRDDGENYAGPHATTFNYITIYGAGRYVGDSLTLFNSANTSGNNWWGEGDDIVYVDGEIFPSQFGTGTEDYYGYAWCRPEEFSSPFVAQPAGEGNLAPGYTVNNRHRILDDITFNQKLRFDMEFWHQQEDAFCEMSVVLFWYGKKGAFSCFQTNESDFKQPVITNLVEMRRAIRR